MKNRLSSVRNSLLNSLNLVQENRRRVAYVAAAQNAVTAATDNAYEVGRREGHDQALAAIAAPPPVDFDTVQQWFREETADFEDVVTVFANIFGPGMLFVEGNTCFLRAHDDIPMNEILFAVPYTGLRTNAERIAALEALPHPNTRRPTKKQRVQENCLWHSSWNAQAANRGIFLRTNGPSHMDSLWRPATLEQRGEHELNVRLSLRINRNTVVNSIFTDLVIATSIRHIAAGDYLVGPYPDDGWAVPNDIEGRNGVR